MGISFSCYGRNDMMVYSFEPGDELDEGLWERMHTGRIRHLLPVKKLMIGEIRLIYDLDGMTILTAYRQGTTLVESRALSKRKRDAIKELVEDGIPVEAILKEDQFVYVQEPSGEMYFACLPLRARDNRSLQNGTLTITQVNTELWESRAVPDVTNDYGSLPAGPARSRTQTVNTGEPADQGQILDFYEPPVTNTQDQMNGIPRIACLTRVSTGEAFPVNSRIYRIGRREDLEGTVRGNPGVGRIHAVITYEENAFFLQDNKSVNGTKLNGKALKQGQKVFLPQASKITLADEDFLFEIG